MNDKQKENKTERGAMYVWERNQNKLWLFWLITSYDFFLVICPFFFSLIVLFGFLID